jgi:NAD-dependent dihydropyrimidine dehydrogenase PreA subunit
MPGTFIDVEIDDSIRGDAELARQLEDACPVDIFAARDGGVAVVEENLDECVLCELCIHTAPPCKLRVRKLYDGSALERCP